MDGPSDLSDSVVQSVPATIKTRLSQDARFIVARRFHHSVAELELSFSEHPKFPESDGLRRSYSQYPAQEMNMSNMDLSTRIRLCVYHLFKYRELLV